MSTEEIRTFADIQNAIIRRAKLTDDATIRADLKEKINTCYQRIAFHKAYRWSGETRSLILKGKYSTGTITATNGSHAITGDGTAWTELAHFGLKIKIGSQAAPYTIKRVASTTSAVIEPAYLGTTASDLTYTIYKDEYGLFPDLHEVRNIYLPGKNRYLTAEGPTFLDDRRYRAPFTSSIPWFYTVNGKAVYASKTWATFLINTDFWEDAVTIDRPKNDKLILYPAIFTDDTMAKVRYTVKPSPLSDDDDEPLMPYANRPILVYGALIESYLQRRDIQTKREWESEYRKYEKAMEGDVETVDDELYFSVDRRSNRKVSGVVDLDELSDE